MEYSRKNALAIKKDTLGKKYSFVNPKKPLGEGGSGIVYLANQMFDKKNRTYIPRAIKFFAYRDDLAETFGYASESNFETEIINITRFSHQNILKVIDGDYYEIEINGKKERIPYTVTEYIDGKTLDKFFEDDGWKEYIKKEDDVFELFAQIANGLEYLHSNDFYHCDIAPKNIFVKVSEESNCFAVIGDLGAGRTITEETTGEAMVIGTWAYMPNEVKKLKGKTIEIEKFANLQPSWDIYSLKVTLKEIVKIVKQNNNLFDTWHLDRLIEKLDNQEYESVTQICKDIELLRPGCTKIMNLDELSEASNMVRQVLIPINPVYMSYKMYDISKHSMLLRLMDVSELLEGATTFPGANHTRYEHALGTYELMRKAIISLLRNKQYAIFFDERTVIIGLLSALLSSLIQYPFSHAYAELVTQERKAGTKDAARKLFSHILTYESYDGSLYESIQKKYPDYQITIEELDYVIFGKPSNTEGIEKLEVLSKILNSSVGVQVIDYLMRDSFHIGLKYRVDIDSLFSYMSINDDKFCLQQYGITTAEQVIMNRYWMFKRVYWSEPNRANVALLKYMFYLTDHTKLEECIIKDNAYESKEKMKKSILMSSKRGKRGKVQAIFNFLDYKGKYRYRRILVVGSADPEAASLWDKIVRRTYSDQESIRSNIEKEIRNYLQVTDEDIPEIPMILIDVPYENTGNKLGGDVNVLRFSGELETLSKASATIGRMHDSFNEQLAYLRVYLHPYIYQKYIIDKKKSVDGRKMDDIERKVISIIRFCLSN